MNIIVCIKQVPAKDAPLSIAGNWIRESDIGFEMNEPDSYALEEALRLKEKHGGEVIVLSMGPERVKQTIKEALAKGADRAIHIADDQFAQLDALGSAKSLAAAIKQQKHDLVLTGLQSDDHGFGQTGVLLAGMLDVPHATITMSLGCARKSLQSSDPCEYSSTSSNFPSSSSDSMSYRSTSPASATIALIVSLMASLPPGSASGRADRWR